MRSQKALSLRAVPVALAVLLAGLTLWACSAMVGGGGPDDTDAGMGGAGDMGGGPPPGPRDMTFDPDAFWANDPPPTYCLADGGTLPPPKPPGGTPECPDDKNRQGCPCSKPGEQAACWPGLRKNRSLGICKDGVTTCTQQEVGSVWGPCDGYVLPAPGATTGADACQCFSQGRWALDNLVPCFYTYNGEDIGAASSVIQAGKPTCISMMKPLTKPSQPWSTNSLTVDCIGRWKLCYTLKAGDSKNPLPTDCVMAQACTEGEYSTKGMPQMLPQLPAWATTTPQQIACAKQFKQSGGYGEMSVDGLTQLCESVKKVFNRVQYCPLSCNERPMDPDCINCKPDGSGGF